MVSAGSVSTDAFLASLTGAVGSRRSTKAQVAAMESFIAAAEQQLLPSSQIIPHILRWPLDPCATQLLLPVAAGTASSKVPKAVFALL